MSKLTLLLNDTSSNQKNQGKPAHKFMALRGNTQSFKLAELLQSLYTSLSSGILSIAQGNVSRKIYLSSGNILLLASHIERPWLGSFLLKHSLISPKDLEITLQEKKVLKLPLLDLLIDKDLLTLKQVLKVIEPQILEEFYEIFLWPDAFFEFQDEEIEQLPEMKQGNFQIFNTNNLVMEAFRREDEWSRIKTLLPSLKVLFEVQSTLKRPFTELEQKLLNHYRTSKPAEAFLQDSLYSKFEVCLATYHLLKENVLSILTGEELKQFFTKALGDKNYAQSVCILEACDEISELDLLSRSRMETALFSEKDFIQESQEYSISLKREKWNLAKLFFTLFLKKHTGVLTIQDPLQTKFIYFNDQRIHIRSQGEHSGISFGDFLLGRGLISQQQLDMLQTHEKIRQISMIQNIKEMGILEEQTLNNLCKEKTLEEIATIFLWKNPYCEFTKNHCPVFLEKILPEDTVFDIQANPLLHKELMNELTQWGDLLEKINSNKIIFQKSMKMISLPLDTGTQEIFQEIDGKQSMQDVFARSNQGTLKVCRSLFQLLNRGLIRPLTIEELKTGAEVALLENKPSLCLKFCEYAFERGEEIPYFQKIQESMKAKSIHFLDTTETYKLEGDLRSVNLAEIFQSFHAGRQSGLFVLKSGLKQLEIHFVRGNIYYHESAPFPLPPEQLTARETNALHQILEVFFWKDATFSFTKNFYLDSFYHPPANSTNFKFETGMVLMQSLQIFEEWEQITRQIPSMYVIFISSYGGGDPFLNYFNGERNLIEIQEKTGFSSLTLCRQVDHLCRGGQLALLNKFDAYQCATQALEDKNYLRALKYYWHIQNLESSNKEIKKIIRLLQKQTQPSPIQDSFSGLWTRETAQLFFTKLSDEFISGTLEFSSGKRFYFSQEELWFFSDQLDWTAEMKYYFLSRQILNEKQFQQAIQTKPNQM
ncbi:MAG: DUF4388 domain-containing protein, partial [Planctomycetota bacterium]